MGVLPVLAVPQGGFSSVNAIQEQDRVVWERSYNFQFLGFLPNNTNLGLLPGSVVSLEEQLYLNVDAPVLCQGQV